MNEDTTVRFSASGRTIPLVSGEVKFIRIFAGDHPQRGVKVRHPSTDSEILTQLSAISWKWCKIGGTLVLITNRKSHMGFRLVPKSMTLSDLERRNGHCQVTRAEMTQDQT